MTVPTLSQSYPIVDTDGNPAGHFVQAWNNLRRQTALFTATTNGIVPLSGGGAVTFLRADGTWAAPSGSGSGTVTSASVTTANGVSGTVATPTTTPAFTLILGAITPTTIVASGAVSGTNLSGTNTGDQTTVSGNAGTATALQTARTINGVSFNGTANITLPSIAYSVVNKTAGYTETTTSGEIVIEANLAAGFTITLPTAVGNTAKLTVKKMLAAGQITIATTSAQTIDSGATAVLNNLGEAITLISNSANWDII